MRALTVCFSALLVLVATAASSADSQGRYVMSPTEGGFARLDTETGAMSLCGRKGDRWVCEPMADAAMTLREERSRLAAENAELKAEVRRLEGLLGPGGERRSAERKFELPSEQDVDRALDYVQRMYRKFRDRLKELEGENKGTPL